MKTVSVIIIGMNEGERLKRCFAAIPSFVNHKVYVDSGSTDGSVDHARSVGVDVVELDMSIPFTAARARNAGVAYLRSKDAPLDYIQFIDGDCELFADWLRTGQEFLEKTPKVAAVCGRLKERDPEASVYNRLADAEWDAETGESLATGGIFMIRADAFDAVGGFDDKVIAGEEPEFCFRLRKEGWQIWRLEDEMALHDIAMTRFSQWWKRTRRAGFTYAEGAWRYGATAERYNVKELLRALIWGAAIPVIGIFSLFFAPMLLLVLLAWPLQVIRLIVKGMSPEQAFFTVLGKIPEALGALSFFLNKPGRFQKQ